MNRSKIIFLVFILFPLAVFGQFNTILPKKVEQKDTEKLQFVPENKIKKEKQQAEKTPVFGIFEKESGNKEQENSYKTRPYVSLPIDTLIVTSEYGNRKHPITGKQGKHKGIDLKANNDYIYSVMPGKVIKTGNDKLLGKYIEVEHGDFRTIYGHLQSFLVNAKQAVEAGQPIAISGNTGMSTGEHLHFGMKFKDMYIDPAPVLNYIYDLIDYVKGDLSKQIDAEIRNK